MPNRFNQNPVIPAQGRWRIEDIPFEMLQPQAIRDDNDCFFLLAAASFVEITSDLYSQTLLERFAHDAEVSAWLRDTWEPQEVQHGVALRRYIRCAWPEFDWDSTYAAFYTEYSKRCATEFLAPTCALELVARCVVETGTASLYTMIQALSPEPLLHLLARRIREDEIQHYRYFYHAFLRYRAADSPSRRDIARTLFRRIRTIDNEDAYLSFKHLYRARNSNDEPVGRAYRSFRRRWFQIARRQYPHEMAIKMFLKPLALNSRVRRAAIPLLAAGARRLPF